MGLRNTRFDRLNEQSGARLRVREGVVVIIKIHAMFLAGVFEVLLEDLVGAVLLVLRLGDTVKRECLFDAVEVECKAVVRDDALTFDKGADLQPHPVEGRGVRGVGGVNVVEIVRPVLPDVVIRGLDEQAEFRDDRAVFHAHKSDLADARAVAGRGFKVDGGKVQEVIHSRDGNRITRREASQTDGMGLSNNGINPSETCFYKHISKVFP
jgi:hypothetical protein